MDSRSFRVTQTTYISFLTHAKQLLLVEFCDVIAGIGKKIKCDKWTNGPMEGQTVLKSEIVI